MKNQFTRKHFALFSAVLVALIAGVAATSVFYSNESPSFSGDGNISRIRASYIIDVYDPSELVGDVDYVFAAKVDKFAGNTYKFPVLIEDEKGNEVEVGSPHTNYYVTVLENIKGKLITGESIPIEKAGGISQYNGKLVLHENDSLPEVGKVYIFLAYAQPDGTLQISGPNSNIEITSIDLLKKNSTGSVKDSFEYSEAVKVFETQKVSDRERFVSIYDVSKQ
ncbi:MAG: hypothetical protein LBU81_08385 [Methanosarcinales archaeon]|nr:hypothetical protein [Methanosarcinales archaeon]